jgi:hypothetical protein
MLTSPPLTYLEGFLSLQLKNASRAVFFLALNIGHEIKPEEPPIQVMLQFDKRPYEDSDYSPTKYRIKSKIQRGRSLANKKEPASQNTSPINAGRRPSPEKGKPVPLSPILGK